MPRNNGYVSKVFGRRRRSGVATKKAVPARSSENWFDRSFASPSDTRPEQEIQSSLECTEALSTINLDRNLLWMVQPGDVVDDHKSPFVTVTDHAARLQGKISVRDIAVAILMAFKRPHYTFRKKSDWKNTIFRFGDLCQSSGRVTATLIVASGGWCEHLFLTVVPKPVFTNGVVIKIARGLH